MSYFKTHLSLLSICFFLQLVKADFNESNHAMVDNFKAENEIIKLRLEVIGLNMEKQNYTIVEVDRKLQTLQNNVEKLVQMVGQLQSSKGIKKKKKLNGPVKTNKNVTSTQDLVDVQNVNHTVGEEELFLSDISEKDEPKVCKLNADKKRICSNRVLGTMCSDSDSINCLNNKCRVRNCIYGSQSFWVACDGEWTVIQRRINGSVDFNRKWEDYKHGFGDLDGEFWIGFDKLHSLTAIIGHVELQIQLQDFNNVFSYAYYDSFSIEDESTQYTLGRLGTYSGNAGDSLRWHRNHKFSTFDRDNDENDTENCATKFHSAWWYCECGESYIFSNLNGVYYDSGVIPDYRPRSGIWWKTFGGMEQSMKFVQIMIKAKKKLK